ncbi:MAG: DUF3857 domain-containing protein [Flavobacteriaceae bacterium]|nr:DUF3857 domain-containing protein [Flavobacteriaceae bacterium]
MRIQFVIICGVLGIFLGKAQELQYQKFNWDSSTKQLLKKAKGIKEKTLLHDKVEVQFVYEEGGELVEYMLMHRAMVLCTDEEIESNNKLYLPRKEEAELLLTKARVIQPKGRVIELDGSKVLTAKDEESGQQYSYFAFEGVEKGSIVEYYYVKKSRPRLNGSRIWLAESNPKQEMRFDLYSPVHLEFALKTYHSDIIFEKDTIGEKTAHWKLRAYDIPSFEDEPQAPYLAMRPQLLYKLHNNNYNGVDDISGYNEVAQNLYAFYYREVSEALSQKLDAILDRSGARQAQGEDRIRAIDQELKTNFLTHEQGAISLEKVLETKAANSRGMVRLYVALLTKLGMEHQIVLTSDRRNMVLDKNFEAHNFLNDFLLYFPSYHSYLSPDDADTRYGYPPAYLTDCNGLYIEEVAIGSYRSAVAHVKHIDAVPASKSKDNMQMRIQFDAEDLGINTISYTREWSGYYAMYYQPYLHMSSEEEREELLDYIAKNVQEEAEVIRSEMLYTTVGDVGKNPLIFKLELETEALTEKAGNNYLFKLGELIGEQQQMYQEKERKLPYESEFERMYERKIVLEIPKGYTIANVEDIRIKREHRIGGKRVFSFVSDYRLQGNTLEIDADEFYAQNKIALKDFQAYRKVINAAADFNKVVLVLQPKK